MSNWEYKILEFTGDLNMLQGFLSKESNEEWELGSLLPAQALGNADQSASALLSSAP